MPNPAGAARRRHGRGVCAGSPNGGASGEGFVDLFCVRFFFVISLSHTCSFIEPFGQPRNVDAAVGAAVGAAIIAFEWNLRRVSLKRLIGAAIGRILGICGAYLFALVMRSRAAEG